MSKSIVAEIHESFTRAELELVYEAEMILKEATEENKEKADRLTKLGFGSAKPVERLSDKKMQEAEQLLHLRKRYSRIAPQYKFLTEDKLVEICSKYKIVVGASERYTEDIPEKNQKDILNFNILDDSFLEISDDKYRNAVWIPKHGSGMHPKNMGTEHLYNALKHICMTTLSSYSLNFDPNIFRAMITELVLRGEKGKVEGLSYYVDQTRLSAKQKNELLKPMKTTYFYVAADIDSFDTKGTELESVFLNEAENDEELAESIKSTLYREYDPIVLAKVQGGYLVVTAWGDEAEDPDVIQPNRN